MALRRERGPGAEAGEGPGSRGGAGTGAGRGRGPPGRGRSRPPQAPAGGPSREGRWECERKRLAADSCEILKTHGGAWTGSLGLGI